MISSWIKKIIAFVLDFIILWFIIGVFEIFIFLFLSPIIIGFKTYITIMEKALDLFIIFSYFYILPNIFGNTPARKLLKIKDKFNLFWSPLNRLDKEYDRFPAKHLKKEKILPVSVKDDRWICPSCSEPSKAIYDVCSNCGQEIEKHNE